MKSPGRLIPALLSLLLFASLASAQILFPGPMLGTGVTHAKGAPFSADTFHENSQTLADGNRIHNQMLGKIYRDSEGRVRNETEQQGITTAQATITDPVARVNIFLDLQHKTARIQPFPSIVLPPGRSSNGEAGDAARVTTPSEPSVIRKTRIQNNAGEVLESREIEGFLVTGTRRTRTIEAGKYGNEKPLVTVYETWYSPELKTDLFATIDDPRSGHSMMKLTNIRVGEPDPLLFQVPADYTIKDAVVRH